MVDHAEVLRNEGMSDLGIAVMTLVGGTYLPGWDAFYVRRWEGNSANDGKTYWYDGQTGELLHHTEVTYRARKQMGVVRGYQKNG